jgi:hypothetical protein
MSDEEFEKRLRADLRRMVNHTSPGVQRRLDEIARGAAAHVSGATRHRGWWVAAPLGAGALAAALAMVMLRPMDKPMHQPATQGDDFALLMNVDNLDLLEQMEFYQWLDREPGLLDAGSADAADPRRS